MTKRLTVTWLKLFVWIASLMFLIVKAAVVESHLNCSLHNTKYYTSYNMKYYNTYRKALFSPTPPPPSLSTKPLTLISPLFKQKFEISPLSLLSPSPQFSYMKDCRVKCNDLVIVYVVFVVLFPISDFMCLRGKFSCPVPSSASYIKILHKDCFAIFLSNL